MDTTSPAPLTLAEIDTLPYTVATLRRDAFDNDDEIMPCAHCGEALVLSLDGVRGRVGHAVNTDTTCPTSPRALALAAYFEAARA